MFVRHVVSQRLELCLGRLFLHCRLVKGEHDLEVCSLWRLWQLLVCRGGHESRVSTVSR
jgi:hypothetical protein